MYRNTCLLYNAIPDVYENLLKLCNEKGFKVKEGTEKFYQIISQKRSVFFWRIFRLKLKIMAVEKEKVQVSVVLYQNRKRLRQLENEFIHKIETSLS